MPDHIHLIAHQGQGAVTLGQWIKGLKAVVAGLECRPDAGSGDPAYTEQRMPARDAAPVGRVPSRGVSDPVPSPGVSASPDVSGPVEHEFTRIKRPWRW